MLSEFHCSTGEWFEDETEDFIQNGLISDLEWKAADLDARGIALQSIESEELLAVGAHEQDLYVDRVTGEEQRGTYLIVGAVQMSYQGAILSEEEHLEDKPVTLGRYLMKALLSDALARDDRIGLVRAVVARDNVRSLRLCDRVGLTRETDNRHPKYVDREGRF